MLKEKLDESKFKIDGLYFNNLQGFYEVISKILLSKEDWTIGSLDGLNDALYGGYGAFNGFDTVNFIWKNSAKSRKDLGTEATKKWLMGKLDNANFDQERIKAELEMLSEGTRPTLFETIIEIFSEHRKINLMLE